MTKVGIVAGLLAAAAWPGVAAAGDKPVYAPAPAWVKPAPMPSGAAADSAPVVVILDNQQRLADGQVWEYTEQATRVASTQEQSQLGTVSLTWMPDKGDLIVHRAEIIRGAEHVDLIAGKTPFTVIRREQALEQLQMDGQLTATMQVEGLRVGDVLRLAYSVTNTDKALQGRMQAYAPMFAAPFRAGFARSRLLWPATVDMKLKSYAEGQKLTPVAKGGERELEIVLPLAKQPELPGDLPGRFQRPPVLEASSFADWAEVSRIMAPLFATDDAIAAGSPLDKEVAAIAAAESDPLRRAERALELVQSQVRYQVMGMDGGNYVPQRPAATWSMRYGDCKAKTLLLLAMLRAMKIDAEPVLASVQQAELVGSRLPAPGAFDHVLVHAVIAGRDYWLDGTGGGARLADIADTPPLRNVLPLRPAGAGLMPIAMRADARPQMAVDVVYDDSAILGLPAVVDFTLTARGAGAESARLAASQADAEQKRDLARAAASAWLGEMQIADSTIGYDAASGTATVHVHGVATTSWSRENGRYERKLDKTASSFTFAPDRARAAWKEYPVLVPYRGSMAVRTTVKLPAAGKGFELEGARTLPATLAGTTVSRTVTFANGVAVVDERYDAGGTEIAPADLPAARAAVAQARAQMPTIEAPRDYAPRWSLIADARKTGRLKPIEDVFAKAIATDPDEVTGYSSRASYRLGTWDYAGGLADLDRMIALAPDAATYLRRARVRNALGQDDKALADAKEALALDPALDDATMLQIDITARTGKGDEAMALADEKIAQGGVARFDWMSVKAETLAAGGHVDDGLKLVDEVIAARPRDAARLNARCWYKGTNNVALDSALADCTRAIEQMENATAALDSRAMVYFRLGRMDDALADLNAALDAEPMLSASLFLRGVILKKQGKAAEATRDLAGARLMDPSIDRRYARWGITA